MVDVPSPSWFAFVPFVGMAILLLTCLVGLRLWPRSPRQALRVAAGTVGYAAVLLVAGLWCHNSLYEGTLPPLVTLVAVAEVGVIAQLLRPRLMAWVDDRLSRVTVVVRRTWLCVAFVSLAFAAASALELPWNYEFLTADRPHQFIELAMLLLALTALFFLARRHGGGMMALIVLCAGVGIVQYFIMRFKSVAILPSDLYALRTALSVSGSYTYGAGSSVVAGLVAALVGIILTSVPPMILPASSEPSRMRRFDLTVGSTMAVVLAVGVSQVSFADHLGVHLMYFSSYSLQSYREHGFLTAFIAAVQDLGIKSPANYSSEQALRDEDRLAEAYDVTARSDEGRMAAMAQFERDKPSVVVIMNETFADLSSFDVLAKVGYKGPARFKAIDDALACGGLAVSVLGGGTCNTEFEFLTGNSNAFIGEGKYPYVMYSLSPFDSLAHQLSSCGYTCSAMHPNEATNWNRDLVYADLGFDRFYSIEDFEGAPVLHSGVSDRATYDKVLDMLAGDDAPQFIFDVTMQNHSGYDQHNVPSEFMRHYGLDYYEQDEWTTNAIDEYLACIEASDQALEYLMQRLGELDRPVVLVFFGDHQPHFSAWINDDLYEDDDKVEHNRRVYETNYVIWANYDIAGRRQESMRDETSADMLAAMTLDLVGAPLTHLQRARIAARVDVPAVTTWGYEGADRHWYAPGETSPYLPTYDALARIAYRTFGSQV